MIGLLLRLRTRSPASDLCRRAWVELRRASHGLQLWVNTRLAAFMEGLLRRFTEGGCGYSFSPLYNTHWQVFCVLGVHIHAGSVWPCVQGHAVHPRVWRPFELYKRYPGREKDVRLNRHRAKLQLATMFTKPRNKFSSRCLISWPLRKKIRTKKWIAQSYPFNVRNFYFLVVILPSEHFEM